MRYFYVYLWYNVFDVNCFIKYGITNNVNNRINEQSKYTTHKPYELFSGGFIEQNIAESIENAIHKFRDDYNYRNCDRTIFEDGYTELLPIESYNQLNYVINKITGTELNHIPENIINDLNLTKLYKIQSKELVKYTNIKTYKNKIYNNDLILKICKDHNISFIGYEYRKYTPYVVTHCNKCGTQRSRYKYDFINKENHCSCDGKLVKGGAPCGSTNRKNTGCAVTRLLTKYVNAPKAKRFIDKFRNANGFKPNENEPKHMKILADACMLKRVPKDYSFKI